MNIEQFQNSCAEIDLEMQANDDAARVHVENREPFLARKLLHDMHKRELRLKSDNKCLVVTRR